MSADIAVAALRLAGTGRKVVPLHSIGATGRCTCRRKDCPSPAKHPRTEHGLTDASAEADVVLGWWRRYPTANLGLLTGAVNGIVVVDLDGQDGVTTFTRLQRTYGPVPVTRWARTGSGGWHAFFKHPGGAMPNSARKLGAGVDTRGDGGYVVAAPSMHVSGGIYAWHNDERAAELPGWLLDLLRPPQPQPRPLAPVRLRGDIDAYAAAAVSKECEVVAAAPSGQRNHTLNASSFSLGTLVGAGRLHESTAKLSLLAAAAACGLSEQEAERTISSGLTAGTRNPRQVVA